ncbi:hypothetical protein EMCG_08712 [[Emmonsia] crescens]|uniref:Uncharacterized protein n=1 Tax=[Emmonsia] crescens TaxID=73230 RepID=A0A0G2I4U7_9EURO|nr:hypothetical protein EMCG_08712 [Emmonsia crescens UAMH 3008]
MKILMVEITAYLPTHNMKVIYINIDIRRPSGRPAQDSNTSTPTLVQSLSE